MILTYPLPHKMWTQLRCHTVNGLLDAVLAGATKVYRPTSYFDIDPDVGGPSYGGYAFWASAYGRYRVTEYDYEIRWCNLQSDAVAVGVYPISDDSTPSELYSTNNVEVADENSLGQITLLGPTAANPTRVQRGTVLAEVVTGSPETWTDLAWAADVGSSPTVNTWLVLTANRINQAALSTGVQYTLTLTAKGYWNQRLSQVS